MALLDPESPLAQQAAEDTRMLFTARRRAVAHGIRDQQSWDRLTSEVVERILHGIPLSEESAAELGQRLGMYLGAGTLLALVLVEDAVTFSAGSERLDPHDPSFGAEWTRRVDDAIQGTVGRLVAEDRTIIQGGCSVTLPDTLLINGTDLQSLCTVTDFSNLRAPGTRRGSNLTYPNVDGDTHVDKVYAAYQFDIPIALSGDDGALTLLERRAAFNAALDALVAVLDTGLLVLTRRLAKVGGGYDETTADGEYHSGLAVQMSNPIAGTTVLEFGNLTGCWLDSSGGKHL